MQTQMHFHQTEKMLTNILYDSGMEQKILKHWRIYEPKLVEDLAWKQMLKKVQTQKASDLIDLQMSLEKTENLPPVLAAMEAWNRLMKPLSPEQGDLDEEEEASWSEMDL